MGQGHLAPASGARGRTEPAAPGAKVREKGVAAVGSLNADAG